MKLAKAILCVLIVSLLVSMAIPMASTKKPPKPPPDEEPPADPAIAFYKQGNRKNPDQIMVMNADGSNQVVIHEGNPGLGFSAGSLSWSPDGASLAWSGYTYIPYVPGYDHGVWRIDVEVVDGVPQGNNLQHLVLDTDSSIIGGAAWSPLGDEIAYYNHLYGGETDEYRIDAVPATGGDPYNIYTSPEGYGITGASSVTWRSDGTVLAFTGGIIADGSEGVSIIIIDRVTGTVMDTLLTGQHPGKIDWAQDLDIIAFVGSQGISTVDIGTGIVVPVVDGSLPSWSPDNTKLVYLAPREPGRGGKQQWISTVDLGTGEITRLANGVRPDWRRF
jgi:Tol biopolymer transport system component